MRGIDSLKKIAADAKKAAKETKIAYCKHLRAQGLTHAVISERTGISIASLWRYLK